MEKEREEMEMKNRESISRGGGFDEQKAWERGRGDAMRERYYKLMLGMRAEESSGGKIMRVLSGRSDAGTSLIHSDYRQTGRPIRVNSPSLQIGQTER